VNLLLDVIEGDAPAELTAGEAMAFVRAAAYYEADAVLTSLPTYLAPLMLNAPYMEVSCMAVLCTACIFTRS
jgi:hypothetical protein